MPDKNGGLMAVLAQVGAVQKFSEPNVVEGFLQRVCAAVGKPAGAPFAVVRPAAEPAHPQPTPACTHSLASSAMRDSLLVRPQLLAAHQGRNSFASLQLLIAES